MPKKTSLKKKKSSSSRKAPKAPKIKMPKPIGVVTHFYGNISVAIVKFNTTVKTGTAIRFSGATTDFAETIHSMQFDHEAVEAAKKGQQIGIKVKKRVREGDSVFPVEK